ncbi:MAG: hypothetical protein AB1324_04280 [Candidatus Micrarchaeota archaeon]
MMLSAEYLILTMVALVMLSASLVALSGIRESAERQSELLRFRSSALSLAASINELCALGDGNSRTMDVQSGLSLESEDAGDGFYAVRFSAPGATLTRGSRCMVRGEKLSGTIELKNEEGIIRARPSSRTYPG